jgi:Spy/CpxP family protein refolding chaperone
MVIASRRVRALFLVAVAGALAACGRDDGPTSAPAEPAPTIDVADLALEADVAALAGVGVGAALPPAGAVVDGVALDRLPAALRLTDAQRARIDSLLRAFADATRADAALVVDAARRAEAAFRAGRPAAEVRAILDAAADARRRLEGAGRALAAALLAVLTPEQRAWLEAQLAPRCPPAAAPALTAEQTTRIRALQSAFLTATRADREALAKVLGDVLAARLAGKPSAEVLAILERATPIRERLAAAEAKLRADVDAVLTPEQRASRCPPVPPLVPPFVPR